MWREEITANLEITALAASQSLTVFLLLYMKLFRAEEVDSIQITKRFPNFVAGHINNGSIAGIDIAASTLAVQERLELEEVLGVEATSLTSLSLPMAD